MQNHHAARLRIVYSALLLSFVGSCVVGCGTSASTGGTTLAIPSTSQGTADSNAAGPVELLNVSCDPTRELWQDINTRFAKKWQAETGQVVNVKQSHGGSSSQARAVNDGLEADILSLAMWPDTDLIRRGGQLADGWEDRLPEKSLPYYSTIVMVVRKGNPKNIHDWPDIVKPGVEIITPNPKTSGNGKLSFLAAYGAVLTRGGTEEQAKDFVRKLYSPEHTKVLDAAARAATMTFSKKGIGDVHLTWENEGIQEVRDSNGELEIVYPPVSFRAEPQVAWVDANVKKHGTEAVAKAFLEFLYTPEAQEAIAKNFYRPNAADTPKKLLDSFQPIKMFDITAVAKNWDDACQRFFDDGGLFDKIYEKQ
jgi:sulfate/thiosulfate transport system substrate-binding protein